MRQNCIFEYKETLAHWLVSKQTVYSADAITALTVIMSLWSLLLYGSLKSYGVKRTKTADSIVNVALKNTLTPTSFR